MHTPKWLWFVLMAVFWWGVWGFLVKLGADRINPEALQILFVVGTLPLLLLVLAKEGFAIQKDGMGVFYGILDGVLATLGMLALYVAMARGKASIVTPLTATPLFTVIGAVLFLKERLNRIQCVGIAMAFVAILIFAR